MVNSTQRQLQVLPKCYNQSMSFSIVELVVPFTTRLVRVLIILENSHIPSVVAEWGPRILLGTLLLIIKLYT